MKVSRYASVDEARPRYLSAVDQAANKPRAKHFTTGPGQAMSYERKEAQARAYKAGESGPFPWLERQRELTGETLDAVADAVIAQADAWEDAAAKIEAQRVAAKQAIRAADTPRAMHDALAEMKSAVGQITDALANS